MAHERDEVAGLLSHMPACIFKQWQAAATAASAAPSVHGSGFYWRERGLHVPSSGSRRHCITQHHPAFAATGWSGVKPGAVAFLPAHTARATHSTSQPALGNSTIHRGSAGSPKLH